MTGQEGCTNTIGPAPYEREENIWAAERFFTKTGSIPSLPKFKTFGNVA